MYQNVTRQRVMRVCHIYIAHMRIRKHILLRIRFKTNIRMPSVKIS